MTDLDRLLELERKRVTCSLAFNNNDRIELESLQKEIQGLIEIRIPILEKTCLIYVDKIESLEQQNKALTEQVKEYEKLMSTTCIDNPLLRKKLYDAEQQVKQLQEEKQKWLESSEGFRKELVEEHKVALSLASERDQLKSKIENFIKSEKFDDILGSHCFGELLEIEYDKIKELTLKEILGENE